MSQNPQIAWKIFFSKGIKNKSGKNYNFTTSKLVKFTLQTTEKSYYVDVQHIKYEGEGTWHNMFESQCIISILSCISKAYLQITHIGQRY